MRYGIIGAAVSFLFAVSVLGVMIWNSQESSHSMMVEADTLGSFIDNQRDAARTDYYTLEAGN